MKTTQAIRNIRKFKKHQTHGIKGRMITDDYGNRYSVKASPNGGVARRHTLSRGKKRAVRIGGEYKPYTNRPIRKRNIQQTRKVRRHTQSLERREKLGNPEYNAKIDYHTERVRALRSVDQNRNHQAKRASRDAAAWVNDGKRKHKDFTK